MSATGDRLYVDIDDTILGRMFRDTFLDLRPGVMTQLTVLSRLFDLYWLTCWPWENERSGMCLKNLLTNLYGYKLIEKTTYMKWTYPGDKVGSVLDPANPQNFWWLEDQLDRDTIAKLTVAGKLDRYIHVDSVGPWAFMDSCLELFKRANVDKQMIKSVGGRIQLFQKECYLP